MNERLSTRSLADILAIQTGLDKERAEKFIDVLSSYIAQGIENNKLVKVMGLGTFKVVLVRERESVHIQTGERFVIPAHHKLSFVPDKDLKEQINRPFAFFEPIEATEEILSIRKQSSEDIKEEYLQTEADYSKEAEHDKEVSEEPVVVLDNDVETISEEVKSVYSEKIPEPEEEYMLPEIEEEADVPEPENFYEETVDVPDVSENSQEQVNFIPYEYEEVNMPYQDHMEDDAHVRIGDLLYEPENVEQERTEKSEIEKAGKKTVPLWLWFLLLPFLIVAGVGIGTYAFLHYNSDKSYENVVSSSKVDDTDAGLDGETTSPLPIGEISIVNTDVVFDAQKTESDDNSEDEVRLVQASDEKTVTVSENNTPEGSTTVDSKSTEENKKEGKPVIDWLAPSPESTKPEPKRADKPNRAIEEKNKSLPVASGSKRNQQKNSNRTSASATNRAKNTSSEKIIPARVRMSAGSSLTQIAMEHYGDKVFWVYIYDYNKGSIKDFNNIPVGTEIRLPQPKTYGINAKSKASVQKARQKQSELLKWDNWDDYQ